MNLGSGGDRPAPAEIRGLKFVEDSDPRMFEIRRFVVGVGVCGIEVRVWID